MNHKALFEHLLMSKRRKFKKNIKKLFDFNNFLKESYKILRESYDNQL